MGKTGASLFCCLPTKRGKKHLCACTEDTRRKKLLHTPKKSDKSGHPKEGITNTIMRSLSYYQALDHKLFHKQFGYGNQKMNI